jgi:hypothetical protein
MWFGVLLSCSVVLLAVAFAILVLKYLSLTPDISLTILDLYVPTPMGGMTLHKLERTTLLQDLLVKIGHVCPNDLVGAIALAANKRRVPWLNRRGLYFQR